MIPILYSSDQTTFTTNGIGALIDCTAAEVVEELNGVYECSINFPSTGELIESIEKGKIIALKPNDTANNQGFRIYRITNNPLNNNLKLYGQHISYDLNGFSVNPFSANNVLVSVALSSILSHSYYTNSFSVSSTASNAGSFSIEKPCSIRNCLGGMEGAILDVFGGEFEFDNFEIKHSTRRGADNGVVISYGKNLTSILDDSSIDKTYTAVYPYATKSDGTVVMLTEKVIETQNLSNYPVPKVLNLDLTEKFSDDSYITESNLRSAANAYITNNRINSISQNIKVSFENLWQSEEYSGMALLERVSLGDTVTIKCEPFNIFVNARVVKTTYDVLNEKYKSIELGKLKSNFSDTLSKIQTSINDLQSQINLQPSVIEAAIAHATELITGGLGGYVIIETNSTTGYPEEILIMDTADKTTAVNVWRFNQNGLGHSHSGYNGPFNDVALTYDGQINASRILTGVLNANLIKTGMISDINDNFEINLTTGHITLKGGAVSSTADIWQAGFTIYHSDDTVATSMFASANDVGVVTAEYILVGARNNEKTTIGIDNNSGYVQTDAIIATIVKSPVSLLYNGSEVGSFYVNVNGESVLNTNITITNSLSIPTTQGNNPVLYSNGANTIIFVNQLIVDGVNYENKSIKVLCDDNVERWINVLGNY